MTIKVQYRNKCSDGETNVDNDFAKEGMLDCITSIVSCNLCTV